MTDAFSFGPTREVNHGGEQRAVSAREREYVGAGHLRAGIWEIGFNP